MAKGLAVFGGRHAWHLFFIFELYDYIHGLITLGDTPSGFVKVGKMTKLVEGDHSIFMMIKGLVALLAALLMAAYYILNIRDAHIVSAERARGKRPNSFKQSLVMLEQKHFAYLVLLPPFIAIVFLSILPLIFSILIAFTNYADPILPPANLVDWVAFDNFSKMINIKAWSTTFTGVLQWTIVWAILATVTTYIGGVLVAILIHQPAIRFKNFGAQR